MKKKNVILSLSVLATGVVALTSCGILSSLEGEAVNKSESLSVEAITGLQSLGLKSDKLVSYLNARNDHDDSDDDKTEVQTTLTQAEIDNITTNILPKADLLFNNQLNLSASKVTLAEGETIQIGTGSYNTIEKFTVSLEGVSQSYSLIYSEVLPAQAKHDDNDDDEIEVVSHISGFAYLGDYDVSNKTPDNTFTFFAFESTLEKETKTNKSEEERTFIIHKTATDYLRIKQENEVKNNKTESEFQYSSYVNGLLSEYYALDIEKKNNKTEIGFTMNNIEYEIVKREINGLSVYCVEIENETTDVEVKGRFVKNQDGTFSLYQGVQAGQ